MTPSSLSTTGPLTSVILVSFHTGGALFQAIDRVLQQRAPIELIVVDNGNPPETIEELRQKAAADQRMTLLSGHGNIGFGRANNMGVKQARGRYLLLVNPDCLIQSDTVEKLVAHAAKLPERSLIGARILNEDGTDQRGCRRELLTPTTALVEALHLGRLFPRHRLNQHERPVPASITPIPALSGAFMFLPRPAFDSIRGFDENYFLHVEDLDFCYRFSASGGGIFFAPDVPVTHIGGTSEATSSFIERQKAKGFSLYFHRNFKDNTPKILLWCLDIAIWGRYLLRRYLTCRTQKS